MEASRGGRDRCLLFLRAFLLRRAAQEVLAGGCGARVVFRTRGTKILGAAPATAPQQATALCAAAAAAAARARAPAVAVRRAGLRKGLGVRR